MIYGNKMGSQVSGIQNRQINVSALPHIIDWLMFLPSLWILIRHVLANVVRRKLTLYVFEPSQNAFGTWFTCLHCASQKAWERTWDPYNCLLVVGSVSYVQTKGQSWFLFEDNRAAAQLYFEIGNVFRSDSGILKVREWCEALQRCAMNAKGRAWQEVKWVFMK